MGGEKVMKKMMNKKGQLGSAIQSLFAVGVTTNVLASLFGKVKSGFISKADNIFFRR